MVLLRQPVDDARIAAHLDLMEDWILWSAVGNGEAKVDEILSVAPHELLRSPGHSLRG